MLENRDKPEVRRLFELAFLKRPAEELYDLGKDPDQLKNVADDLAYAKIKSDLGSRLAAELKATGDPRVAGHGDVFDRYPYYGGRQSKRK
jgi:N-sulfoglucosamine sulfohydrolase